MTKVLSPRTILPSDLDRLRREAKSLKKQHACKHGEALKQLVKACGFRNWQHASSTARAHAKIVAFAHLDREAYVRHIRQQPSFGPDPIAMRCRDASWLSRFDAQPAEDIHQMRLLREFGEVSAETIVDEAYLKSVRDYREMEVALGMEREEFPESRPDPRYQLEKHCLRWVRYTGTAATGWTVEDVINRVVQAFGREPYVVFVNGRFQHVNGDLEQEDWHDQMLDDAMGAGVPSG